MRSWIKYIVLVLVGLLIFYLREGRNANISISPLKNYAIECKPCSKQLVDSTYETLSLCDKPPVPSSEVIRVLDHRKIDDDYKKFVLLVYLKLYREQISLYGQSFEVRQTPYVFYRFSETSAMSRAFCEIIGTTWITKKFGPEFLPASDAYYYIREHNLFENDTIISAEMREIDRLVNNY